jgi:hypothetical protein
MQLRKKVSGSPKAAVSKLIHQRLSFLSVSWPVLSWGMPPAPSPYVHMDSYVHLASKSCGHRIYR